MKHTVYSYLVPDLALEACSQSQACKRVVKPDRLTLNPPQTPLCFLFVETELDKCLKSYCSRSSSSAPTVRFGLPVRRWPSRTVQFDSAQAPR